MIPVTDDPRGRYPQKPWASGHLPRGIYSGRYVGAARSHPAFTLIVIWFLLSSSERTGPTDVIHFASTLTTCASPGIDECPHQKLKFFYYNDSIPCFVFYSRIGLSVFLKSGEGLRDDLHRCTDRYGPPDFIHLLVGDGDTAVCPVLATMPFADPAHAVL
jgi:hypothetical protein